MSSKESLRQEIIQDLEAQGFLVNPHLRPKGDTKDIYKMVQDRARLERIQEHKAFLIGHTRQVGEFLRSGSEVEPSKIELKLCQVKPDSWEENLFRWWNLVWWSIPYERSYGRQMRFLLWDITHNAPFGLIGLHSPPLRVAIRDNALGISQDKRDWWANMSLSAQRVGALPPYNELLGGKMVALSLTANEIREVYRERYQNRVSLIRSRFLPADLLFITTTGAFGKSSLYNRLTYENEPVAEFLGYSEGSGAFHISNALYRKILEFLGNEGIETQRGYGHGPSRKRQLLSIAFRLLRLPDYEYHGIQRGFYLFSLVKNLKEVIQKGALSEWYDRPFDQLMSYWKQRWGLPRAERLPRWRQFQATSFMESIKTTLEAI